MLDIAPPFLGSLSENQLEELLRLTKELLVAAPESVEELHRFDEARARRIDVASNLLAQEVSGRRVLVTGGTGCIGEVLFNELEALSPSSLVSLSRGFTVPRHMTNRVRYELGDVWDSCAVRRTFARHRPEIVFNLAGQRFPGLAEDEKLLTIRTNIFGTQNVLDACAESGVHSIVHASTGKALRPYMTDTYGATKRVAEWLVASHADPSMKRALIRFTHVVDNSSIREKIEAWVGESVVRLHGPQVLFFIQSAIESAQLLLSGAVESAVIGDVPLLALRDIGHPVSLTDLALGFMKERGEVSPIYFSGFDHGYEESLYPGLYVPETSVEVSPLLSSLEAVDVAPSNIAPAADLVRKPPYGTSAEVDAARARLGAAASAGDAVEARMALDELLRALLSECLQLVPAKELARIAAFAHRYRDAMVPEHFVLDDALRAALGQLPDYVYETVGAR